VWYNIKIRRVNMAKNEVTRQVEPGIMAFDCEVCRSRKTEGTGFVSIPLIVFSTIKVWGAKVFHPKCNNCGAAFEVTLTP